MRRARRPASVCVALGRAPRRSGSRRPGSRSEAPLAKQFLERRDALGHVALLPAGLRRFFSTLGAQVSFQSDTETALTLPPGIVTTLLPETGLPQIALQTSLSVPRVGSVDLTVNVQSDLDNGGGNGGGDLAPVPEPSTLLLFGSSFAWLGALWRRSRHT